MKTIKQLSIIGLTSLVVACGGGGGSSSSTDTNSGGTNTGGTNTGGTNTGGTNTGGTNTGGTNTGAQSNLEQEFSKWITDMADGYIIPAYRELADASLELQQASQACSNTDFNQSQLDQVKTAWQGAFNKWQSVQWLKLGPAIDESRLFRIQTWPDNNDAVDRGMSFILGDTQAITTEYLSTKNTGAQGLPALESLLYPDSSANSLLTASDKERRCEALQGISANMVKLTSEIVTAWSEQGGNYRANFINGTGEFTGKVDVVEEVATIYLENLELVKDEKLLVPLSLQKPGIPTLTESYRSDISLSHAQASIQALSDIFTAKGGHGFDDILISHLDQASIATQMTDALTKAQTNINSLSGSLVEALNDDAKRATITEVIDALRDFRTVFAADFVQATELNIGFNSNDGD